MRRTPDLTPAAGLGKLAGYPFHVLTWVDGDGYPMSAAVTAVISIADGTATFRGPAELAIPADAELSLTGSHIRPQPGYGYDERRHVTVWGRPEVTDDGRIALRASAAWGWDEAEVPFFEYSERSTGQSRRYFDALTAERGTPVRPRLSLPWLAVRATRLPFLTATFVPVLVGLAIAASRGFFEPATALLTVVGAAAVQLGLNVLNDVFDTRQGADDANVTPTQFSGGSRVIQYGLVSISRMTALAAVMYAIAGGIGLVLLALRPSVELLAIGAAGLVVSAGYTAPPLKLVYRGLGEIAVAVGFGPLMLLGAYAVQSGGPLALEPFVASIPIAILVALILYVNEIPDRRGDAHAGKRTLPVRLSREAVIRIYDGSVAVAFAVVIVGVVIGVLPVPALLVLALVPLARRVSGGIRANYDNPYGLMAFMGVNIRLHLYAGLALLATYVIVLLAGALAPEVSLFLRR
jgi:1,4-dihydroxy-2-naphthoate octaprenyltransferase